MLKRLLAVLFGVSSAASCTVADQWLEGGLYVAPRGDGTFAPLKILKLDDRGVHVRTYSNIYAEVPSRIDESSLYMAGMDNRGEEPPGMGHLPISRESFASWGATFIQKSSVSPDELEGYHMWSEAEGGYF